MAPFLAQAASEYAAPSTLNSWLECAFWVVAFAAALAHLWNKTHAHKSHNEIGPQPFEVRETHEFATTADIDSLKDEFDRRLTAMSESSKGFRDNMRAENKNIGERVASIEASLEGQNRQLFHIDAKLDRLIER